MRARPVDVDRMITDLRRAHEHTLRSLTGDAYDDMPASFWEGMDPEVEETLRAGQPPSVIENVRRDQAAEIDALDGAFPLAFVAQIDLDALAGIEGFDPALPGSGLLSIFIDTTHWAGGAQIRHFAPSDNLERATPPDQLRAYTDARWPDIAIYEADQCERLLPRNAVSVPYHWAEPRHEEVSDWIRDHSEGLTGAPYTGRSGYFGDMLGGWPEVIQDSPEYDLDPALRTAGLTPGKVSWRQVFSCAGEGFLGTRTQYLAGDGHTYFMVPEDGFTAQDYRGVQQVYQQT